MPATAAGRGCGSSQSAGPSAAPRRDERASQATFGDARLECRASAGRAIGSRVAPASVEKKKPDWPLPLEPHPYRCKPPRLPRFSARTLYGPLAHNPTPSPTPSRGPPPASPNAEQARAAARLYRGCVIDLMRGGRPGPAWPRGQPQSSRRSLSGSSARPGRRRLCGRLARGDGLTCRRSSAARSSGRPRSRRPVRGAAWPSRRPGS